MSSFLAKAKAKAAGAAAPTAGEIPPPPAKAPEKKSLASVFADAGLVAMQDATVRLIPLNQIITEDQVRLDFDEGHIGDLANSFGPSRQPEQPVTVWVAGDKFMLASGENRLRAKLRLQAENPLEPECLVIRASVLGEMPTSYMDRQKVRIRENVLRKDLTDYELMAQAKALLVESPGMMQKEIAAWFGFENQASAIAKISYLLKLAEYPETDYPDVFAGFKAGQFKVKKALELIKEYDRERALAPAAASIVESASFSADYAPGDADNSENSSENNDLTPLSGFPEQLESSKARQKVENVGKRATTFSLTEEQALALMKIARKLADDNGLETLDWGGKLTRKSFNDILKERLPELLELIE